MSEPGVQGFPHLGADFTDRERKITYPWYSLLLALWRMVGGSNVSLFESVYLKQDPPGSIFIYDTSEDGIVGEIRLKDFPGDPEVSQTPTVSPFLFTAPGDGTLIASSCKVEISRTGGYFLISLCGASVSLMKDDVIRLSWLGPLPVATWFPSG